MDEIIFSEQIQIKYPHSILKKETLSELSGAAARGHFFDSVTMPLIVVPGFWMTELQALAISSRLASSGYWFSMKKLLQRQTATVLETVKSYCITGCTFIRRRHQSEQCSLRPHFTPHLLLVFVLNHRRERTIFIQWRSFRRRPHCKGNRLMDALGGLISATQALNA